MNFLSQNPPIFLAFADTLSLVAFDSLTFQHCVTATVSALSPSIPKAQSKHFSTAAFLRIRLDSLIFENALHYRPPPSLHTTE
jgi:hypothetical protein